jgi:hypothetical protein
LTKFTKTVNSGTLSPTSFLTIIHSPTPLFPSYISQLLSPTPTNNALQEMQWNLTSAAAVALSSTAGAPATPPSSP